MTLRPNKTTQKALISTTSRLVGEYEKDDVLVTHAWPDFYDRSKMARTSEGPASRSAFIFAFKTRPIDRTAGITIPNYSPMGALACSYLSVLFGKRFDSHGLLENSGFFHVPDLTQFGHLCNHHLPFNSHMPRVDFPVPLNLAEISRIDRLIHDEGLDPKFVRAFQVAAKFYLQAIQNAELDPEVAYLHLITSGEMLSNFHEYEKTALMDVETRHILGRIRTELHDGNKVANFMSGKLLQVKRRFAETIIQLVDSSFFDRTESRDEYGRFKKNSFKNAISAAYDLRSRYVHTGVPFGGWISLWQNEVQFGQPVVEDKELGKILALAPTFTGLERVIRYCLLRFAQLHDAYVEPQTESVDDA